MIAKICAFISFFIMIQEISSNSFTEFSAYSNLPKDNNVLGRQSFTSAIGSSASGLILQKPAKASFAQTNFIVNNSTVGVCICVTSGSCGLAGGSSSTGGSTDGSGIIDPRIVNNVPTPVPSGTSGAIFPISSGITPAVVNQNFCQSGLDRCCPVNGYSCGIRYPPIVGSKAPTQGQAAYGAYPWQAVILGSGDAYQGSGALIDHIHILTAAHKVNSFLTNGQQLKVRLGEWDASSSVEILPVQEFYVTRIFIHPQYVASNLKNDIAILRLATSVPLGTSPTIGTACIPSILLTNVRCWVSGWGRNDFSSNGAYQAIQREVDVPIVDQNTCQNNLKTTRLGSSFQLDFNSFMCAGGETGKDACTGDGGSPLMCLASGQWYVAGLVAWGIGCGSNSVPGVYVNVYNYRFWIQQTTRS